MSELELGRQTGMGLLWRGVIGDTWTRSLLGTGDSPASEGTGGAGGITEGWAQLEMEIMGMWDSWGIGSDDWEMSVTYVYWTGVSLLAEGDRHCSECVCVGGSCGRGGW